MYCEVEVFDSLNFVVHAVVCQRVFGDLLFVYGATEMILFRMFLNKLCTEISWKKKKEQEMLNCSVGRLSEVGWAGVGW